MDGLDIIRHYFLIENHLNQYSEEGIKFEFFKPQNKTELNSFVISEGNVISDNKDSKNKTVDIDTTHKFILKRYAERKSLVSEMEFINEELEYLDKFPNEFFNEFEYQLKPLRKELEKLKETGIKKLIDLQKPKKMSLHISNNPELKKELEAYISKYFDGKISLKTTLTELETILDRKSVIKKEIEKRMSIAPDKVKVLELNIQYYQELTIAQIRYIAESGYPEFYDYDVYFASYLHDLDGYKPQGMARHLIEKGLDFSLFDFGNLFTLKFDKVKNNKEYGVNWQVEYSIQDLADGVALAYLLPELEKELQELREPKMAALTETVTEKKEIKTENKKLKWHGKPAQLAYVISLLKKNGYINYLPDETTAEILLGAFDIENYNPSKGSLGNSLRKGTDAIGKDADILRIEKLLPKLKDLQ